MVDSFMSVLATDWQLVICEVWHLAKAIIFSFPSPSPSHCHLCILSCVCVNQKSKTSWGQTVLSPSTLFYSFLHILV